MTDPAKISLKDLSISTRLLHEELSSDQEAMCRYSFKYAGRFVVPTYEQWEHGFLTERDLDSEFQFWMNVSFYIKNSEFRDDWNTKRMISQCCSKNFPPHFQPRIDRFFSGDPQAYVKEAVRDRPCISGALPGLAATGRRLDDDKRPVCPQQL